MTRSSSLRGKERRSLFSFLYGSKYRRHHGGRRGGSRRDDRLWSLFDLGVTGSSVVVWSIVCLALRWISSREFFVMFFLVHT